MKTNSWCRVCGKEYYVCPVCEETKRSNPWKIVCDTSEHYKIWLITEQFRKGIVDKTTARKSLALIGITPELAVDFIPAVRDYVASIMKEENFAVEAAALQKRSGNGSRKKDDKKNVGQSI